MVKFLFFNTTTEHGFFLSFSLDVVVLVQKMHARMVSANSRLAAKAKFEVVPTVGCSLMLPLVAALAVPLPDAEDAREHSIAAHRVVHAAQRVLSLAERAAQPLLASRARVLVEHCPTGVQLSY